MSECFRFSNAFERTPFNVFDQYVDAFYDSFVGFLPVEIIFPSLWGKKEVHASRSISLFLAFPFSRLSSEETSLFAFDGLLSR